MPLNNTPVAVVKYDETPDSLRKAIELANGFEDFPTYGYYKPPEFDKAHC
jgi:hypothetical protein